MELILALKLIDLALLGLEVTPKLLAHRDAVVARLKSAAQGDHVTEAEIDAAINDVVGDIDAILAHGADPR